MNDSIVTERVETCWEPESERMAVFLPIFQGLVFSFCISLGQSMKRFGGSALFVSGQDNYVTCGLWIRKRSG